jgi:hypothetical protein
MWTLTTSATRPMLLAMLLPELADFFTRHRPCGELTCDITEPVPGGYLLTVTCSF